LDRTTRRLGQRGNRYPRSDQTDRKGLAFPPAWL
jgi:hypothetical protein